MKLEVGKYYINRLGNKIGPLVRGCYVTYPFSSDYRTFTEDGRVIYGGTDPGDLVAEWVESPNPTDAEVVRLFNELVKAGRVQFCESIPTTSTSNWLGQDAEQRIKPERICVLKDSWHKVVVDGGAVKVGCVEFGSSRLSGSLALLLDGSTTQASGLHANGAKGLRHAKGTMTWADAGQLLEFLTAAQGSEGKK